MRQMLNLKLSDSVYWKELVFSITCPSQCMRSRTLRELAALRLCCVARLAHERKRLYSTICPHYEHKANDTFTEVCKCNDIKAHEMEVKYTHSTGWYISTSWAL